MFSLVYFVHMALNRIDKKKDIISYYRVTAMVPKHTAVRIASASLFLYFSLLYLLVSLPMSQCYLLDIKIHTSPSPKALVGGEPLHKFLAVIIIIIIIQHL